MPFLLLAYYTLIGRENPELTTKIGQQDTNATNDNREKNRMKVLAR